MSIQVTCGGCGKSYRVEDRFAGKRAKCKACATEMVVPGTPAPATAAPPPAKAAAAPRSAAAPRQSAAKPPPRKPVTAEKADGEFDFSALDAIEQSGAIDDNYVAPVAVAALPRDAGRAATAKGTAFPPHLRAGSAGAAPGQRFAPRKADPGDATFADALLKPGPVGFIFLGVVAIGFGCLLTPKAAAIAGIAFLVIGILLNIAAKLMILVVAFGEGAITGLLVLFAPFYDLYFLITRWREARTAVFTSLKSAALIGLAILLLQRAGGSSSGGGLSALARSMPGARAPSGSSSSSANSSDDGYADDLDSDPNLTLTQKMVIRSQRRRQKDIEALGYRMIEAPTLPKRTEFPEVEKGNNDGLDQYDIHLDGEFQGEPIAISVYMPEAEQHPNKSLACVLAPAAGVSVLSGRARNQFDDPYKEIAHAGLAVVCFDVSRWSDNVHPLDPQSGPVEFMETDAGYHFARSTLELILARFPMIDPDRIYAAGRGQAARVALYYAAVDPRIRAVATYQPVLDVALHTFQPPAELEKELRIAGVQDFLKKTSPTHFAAKLKAKVLVVSAKAASEDSEATPEEISAFAAAMQNAGNPITMRPLKKSEDKNDLDAAMEQMALWLKELPKGRPQPPTTTAPTEPPPESPPQPQQ